MDGIIHHSSMVMVRIRVLLDLSPLQIFFFAIKVLLLAADHQDLLAEDVPSLFARLPQNSLH